MKVWSLSSGSTGNCYLVQERGSLLLLEAGVGVRRIQRELASLGFTTSDLSAVLASHEHVDHWRSAVALARRHRFPVVCSEGSWKAAGEGAEVPMLTVKAGGSVVLGDITVEPFSLSHDARQPVGFVLRSDRATLCLATDTGRMTEEIVERALDADLVILEANHDVDMLVRGPYPAHLKRRILGDRGHLSNEEAGRTMVRLARGRPTRFWLAHLSDTNNSPRVALQAVQAELRREGLDGLRVEVALRDCRSLAWDSQMDEAQLRLF